MQEIIERLAVEIPAGSSEGELERCPVMEPHKVATAFSRRQLDTVFKQSLKEGFEVQGLGVCDQAIEVKEDRTNLFHQSPSARAMISQASSEVSTNRNN